MANRDFSVMYDYVMPYLPGAEPGVIDFHIRRVLREFFKRTTVWRKKFTFDTVVGESAYQLNPGVDEQVSSILWVRDHNDRYLNVLPEESRAPVRWQDGEPRGWFNLLPEVISLAPTPAGVYQLTLEAALTIPIEHVVTALEDPGNVGAIVPMHTFPGEIFDEHAENLAAGVISGMMLMPGKPWTKLDSGSSYGRIFGAAIRDLRGKIRDGGQPNASTFTGPRFGA